jgi:hypothetical protein
MSTTVTDYLLVSATLGNTTQMGSFLFFAAGVIVLNFTNGNIALITVGTWAV